MCLIFFSTLSEIFFILRSSQRAVIINVHRCSCKVPVIFVTLIKLEFSRQIFEKTSNTKLNENPSSGSRVLLCGPTDRLDEAHSRFSVLRRRLKELVQLQF
jgi:hypothetical protein